MDKIQQVLGPFWPLAQRAAAGLTPLLGGWASVLSQSFPHIVTGLGFAARAFIAYAPSLSVLAPLKRGLAARGLVGTAGVLLVVAIAALLLSPILGVMAVFAPGILIKLAVTALRLVTGLSHEIGGHAADVSTFMRALRESDSSFADTLEERLRRVSGGGGPSVRSDLGARLLRKLWRSGRSLSDWKGWALSLVPIVGPLYSTVTHLYRASEETAEELLSPFAESEGWSQEHLHEWVSAYRYTLAGFALPFTLLAPIPIIGSWAWSIGQAGMAKVLCALTTPEHRRRVSRGSFAGANADSMPHDAVQEEDESRGQQQRGKQDKDKDKDKGKEGKANVKGDHDEQGRQGKAASSASGWAPSAPPASPPVRPSKDKEQQKDKEKDKLSSPRASPKASPQARRRQAQAGQGARQSPRSLLSPRQIFSAT